MSSLPLIPEHLASTRDYLQDVTKVLSSLQRAFVPANPHDWQYGLEVVMRGLRTQPFSVGQHETWALLDLVRHKVRLGSQNWALGKYDAPQMLGLIRDWLSEQGVEVKLEEPKFAGSGSQFDPAQADAYASALWWVDVQFQRLATGLNEGLVSPILLYPHHFDLALTWFPWGDERQLSIGFSTGDKTIAEPYIYLTAYPELPGFTNLELPSGAHWQREGFRGAILPYTALQASRQPEALLQEFTAGLLAGARQLF